MSVSVSLFYEASERASEFVQLVVLWLFSTAFGRAFVIIDECMHAFGSVGLSSITVSTYDRKYLR